MANQDQRANSTQTVTVACKMPHGLMLHAYAMVKRNEPVMGGGYREIEIAQRLPAEFRINGNAFPQNAGPKCQIVGGFAITPNVPKDLWDKWLEQNKDADYVKNGLIFAHTIAGTTEGVAKERHEVRSGLERLDPAKMPKGLKKFDPSDKDLAAA